MMSPVQAADELEGAKCYFQGKTLIIGSAFYYCNYGGEHGAAYMSWQRDYTWKPTKKSTKKSTKKPTKSWVEYNACVSSRSFVTGNSSMDENYRLMAMDACKSLKP